MKTLAVIPARGGSKGIPDKCIAPCAGHPLLYYTCRAALKSKSLDRVILSTDSERIAAVGRQCGVDVPFLRPADLAQDESPMIGVLKHALAWAEQSGEKPGAVVLLQPTSPLRTARHIDEAVKLFFDNKADSVVSVVEVPHQFTPVSLMDMRRGRLVPYLKDQPLVVRRQDKPKLYARNGPAVLVLSSFNIRKGILYGNNTVGYVMSARESLDVDGPEDLALAGLVLSQRRKAQKK